MRWTALSADLNPIELAWDELDWNVTAKQSTSTAHLWQLLQESLAELSLVYFQSLFEWITRIGEVVISPKGYHFAESKV